MCLKDSKLSLLRVSIIAALANKYAKPIKKKLLIFRLNTRQNRADLYYLHQNVISEVCVNEINFKKKACICSNADQLRNNLTIG
jgi:hypothetical protein|tara:strand:+ start:353 stop:604 length:252 start_codon:yes stop_codon:yes gene_type:complete